MNGIQLLAKKMWALSWCLIIGVLFACGSVASAEEATNTALPEISLRQLSDSIHQSRERYKKGYMEAIYRDQRDTNAFSPNENPAPVMVDFHGRFSYANDGFRWRAAFEGKTYRQGSDELFPRNWLAGFDGKHHYSSESSDGFTIGKMQAHENIPTEIFFWSSHGAGFANSLANNQWKFIEQPVIDGYRCYALVLERTFREDYKQRQELTVSPRQSFLPIVYKVFANGKLSWSMELQRLKQADALWYPGRVVNTDTFMNRKRDARVRVFDPNRVLDPDFFQQESKLGQFVRDNRTGHVYLNDPWWPEVKVFLRDKFDWPPVDLVPLRDAVSHVENSMQGTDAMELHAAEWIQGKPVSIESRKGKVTLLQFATFSMWRPNPRRMAALKEIYRIYKPFGLEMVGISTASTARPTLERNLGELAVSWPVCIDSKGTEDSSNGKTFENYKLRTYVSTVLVDHDSKVHIVQNGQLTNLIKKLLENAGEVDVPEVSLDFVNQPNAISRELSKAWKNWVRGSARHARISGQLRLDGKPVPNATISAQLRLEIAGSAHHANATHIIPWREKTFQSQTDEDGSFAITNLCKGTYELTIDIPGKSPRKQKVSLGSATTHLEISPNL